jgi:trans-aconitate 2-methyltransferase
VSPPQYLFGDSDAAFERLQLLGRVYHESTRTFLAKAAASEYLRLGLDLGCGPGFTTHLIAETLRCERVIGLDASEGFIKLARTNANERVMFLRHDINAVPFPNSPANLIFCRFLLSHLRNPAAVIAKWATQLDARGLLLLEEAEAIVTAHPVFARYLTIVEAMLAAQSNQLYAGRLVANLHLQGALQRESSELRPLPVRNCEAARMFELNLRTWKDSEFVRNNYSRDCIAELDNELSTIATGESSAHDIEWEMRQATWRKN